MILTSRMINVARLCDILEEGKDVPELNRHFEATEQLLVTHLEKITSQIAPFRMAFIKMGADWESYVEAIHDDISAAVRKNITSNECQTSYLANTTVYGDWDKLTLAISMIGTVANKDFESCE